MCTLTTSSLPFTTHRHHAAARGAFDGALRRAPPARRRAAPAAPGPAARDRRDRSCSAMSRLLTPADRERRAPRPPKISTAACTSGSASVSSVRRFGLRRGVLVRVLRPGSGPISTASGAPGDLARDRRAARRATPCACRSRRHRLVLDADPQRVAVEPERRRAGRAPCRARRAPPAPAQAARPRRRARRRRRPTAAAAPRWSPSTCAAARPRGRADARRRPAGVAAPPARERLEPLRRCSSTGTSGAQRGEPQDGHLEHELRIDRAGRRGDRFVGVEQQPEGALQVVRRALRRLRARAPRPRPPAARARSRTIAGGASTARWRKCSSRSRQKRRAS